MRNQAYWDAQPILLREMEAMVTAWVKEDDESGPLPRRKPLNRREQARVHAAILSVMRTETFAATIDEIIEALVNAGYWLPTLCDGATGYVGEMQRLQRLWIPMGQVERVELVSGSGRSLDDRWRYVSEEPWINAAEMSEKHTAQLLGIWPRRL